MIADAFFRGGQDPSQMAKILGVETFDLNLFTHPYVKKEIVSRRAEMNQHYTLAEHITNLKKLRDAVSDPLSEDFSFKYALSAEVALGKAAGLYLPRPVEIPDQDKGDATTLTTAELRQRLAKATQALTGPAEVQIFDNQPADPPIELEDYERDSDEI